MRRKKTFGRAIRRLLLATDHARTGKSRRVLKQFFWGRGPRKKWFGCLDFASTCGTLGRARRKKCSPLGGGWQGSSSKSSARLVGAGTPKACSVDGARAESTQPKRAALL